MLPVFAFVNAGVAAEADAELARAFQHSAHLDGTRDLDEVVAAERTWAESYQSCDMAVVGRILSDDLTLIVHTNGATMGKEQFLKSMTACSQAASRSLPKSDAGRRAFLPSTFSGVSSWSISFRRPRKS